MIIDRRLVMAKAVSKRLRFIAGIALIVPVLSPAAGRAAMTAPFVLNGSHIVIEVSISGKTLHLTLDNGNVMAPTVLYGSPKIDSLNLDYEGEAQVGGAGDGEMPIARIAPSVTLGLAGTEIPDQMVVVMPYDPALLAAFAGEDGVIGGTIWERFVGRIDFESQTITLTDPEDFSYSGKGQEFTMGTLSDGGSTLTGTMTLLDGTEIPALFHLDLGSGIALSVNVGSRPEITEPEKTIARKSFGSQGEFTEHVGRIRSLQLGDFVIKNVLTSFTSTPSLSQMGNEGDIGGGIFQRFTVTFDYANNRLFLEPNSHFSDPFEFDMSGLGLRKTSDGDFAIARVLPDSPASEAGLMTGDIVTKIDGRSSKDISRDEVRQTLMQDGKTVSLTVVREGQPQVISIRLRRLI